MTAPKYSRVEAAWTLIYVFEVVEISTANGRRQRQARELISIC
jgi:hypothetical protein